MSSDPKRKSWRRQFAELGLFIVAGLVLWHTAPGIPPAAAAALDNPDSFELISLNPHYEGKPTGPAVGDHRILGQTQIIDRATQRRLIRALKWGARQWTMPYACFNPRHCIRVTTGGKVIDIVICFECGNSEVHTQDGGHWEFHTTSFPQSTFDQVLQEAGVPLAPKEH